MPAKCLRSWKVPTTSMPTGRTGAWLVTGNELKACADCLWSLGSRKR